MDRAGLVEMIDVDPWTGTAGKGNHGNRSVHCRANFEGQNGSNFSDQ